MTKVTSGLAIAALVIGMWIGIGLTNGTSRVRANNFTVMNLDDSGDGSLRQAILDANANPGPDSIDFQDELAGTILLTSGQLPAISEDLTINGPGVFSITVSGNHASRVFEVNGKVTVMISGLTISDGNSMSVAEGAGISNLGTLTLSNVVLSGNSTTGSAGGGGIFNNGFAMLTITNCTLSGNSAAFGGGIENLGTLTITSSTLSGNSARADGGGILNNGGTLTITNSTLSGNTAQQQGGGIFQVLNAMGTANISFTTLSGNSATLNGGGIFNAAPNTVNIKNSIVANSTSGGDCSNSGTFNATGVNFTTNGTCPGFTVVTPAQLNLGPLQNNGGNTETHALLPGSVAIDAAPDCTDVFGTPERPKVGAPMAVVTTDQRGVGRPQGSACDVGSYEFVPCTTTPTIVCPESFTISTGATLCSAVVDFSPTADCPCENGGGSKPPPSKSVGVKPPLSPAQGCMVSCAPAAGSTFPRGTTTVTCTASDSFGNTSKPCSFTITVTDQTPPAVSCPANIVKNTDPNQCSTTATYTATANDNCDGPLTPTCDPASGSTFQKGVTTVTCMATDSSKNTGSCQFTVTVNDNQPPSITCPANITRNNDPNQCSAVVTYPAPTVSDNCPNVGMPTCSPASGTAFPVGTTTVSCSVSDASNNTASCSFTVTVNDTQPPTITCPANITKPTDPNQCSAVVTYPPPTVTDNCPGLVPTCSPASGSAFPKGTTTVNCSVMDASHNTATCSFTVTVQDMQPPTITCPPNGTFVAPASCPPANTTPGTLNVTATDNCPGVVVVCRNQNGVVVTQGSPFPIGTTTVTCTATDTSGNTASCTFTITGFSFCLQDDVNPGNVVLIDAVSGAYRFCCGGVLVATGKGTITTRGCIGSIDDTKGARRVHIQWDTSANGAGAGTAIIQVSPNKTVCQITDMKMTDNNCSCSDVPPVGSKQG
ncbi:MAG TPA: HYR domain-containing protein [Blastocatellia bacterium]|nr:HYR domain-containing protein [Blastocatellia bacterium]